MHDCQTSPYALANLIARIRREEEAGGAWSLASDEIREILGIEPRDFYRKIYSADMSGHPLIGLSAADEMFSQDNIWEFVALVELFCGSETERRLQEAGVFFTHPEQLEIMGTFVIAASQAVRQHSVDREQFSAMLAAFGGFDRARRCYLDEHFDLESLIEVAVARYCDGRTFGVPELARRNVRWLLRYFFQKHVLEPRDLFAGVSAALFEQAVREGYEEAPKAGGPGTGPGRASGDGAVQPSALEQARGVMELDGRPVTLAVLKSQYKRLMKRYHPDLNPAGLRRCQEINAAYSLLLTAC